MSFGCIKRFIIRDWKCIDGHDMIFVLTNSCVFSDKYPAISTGSGSITINTTGKNKRSQNKAVIKHNINRTATC